MTRVVAPAVLLRFGLGVAGVLAAAALGVAAACALARLGFVQSEGWAAPLAGASLVAGALVTSVLFDALARYGIRFGKFLVLGPLLAGLYVALTPLAEMRRLDGTEQQVTLLRWAFLGVLIGDSAGLGVEVADLLAAGKPVADHEPESKRAMQESST